MVSKETSVSGLKTMQLNDQKAGMEGLDKEMINKIIFEASKGTSYFNFQEKRQKSIDSKVKELFAMMNRISERDKRESLKKMTALGQELENRRDLSHSIVHIDMDAFYAAVEMHDNPDLKDKPMAVGSLSMLSTSNYHARKFGVRAAMPGFIAKKLCPELIIVPCNFDKYRKVSKVVRSIVQEYDPDYCAASLDEVYLDLTEFIKNKYRRDLHENYCLKNDVSDTFSGMDEMDEDNANVNCCDYINCMGCSEPISNEQRDKIAYSVVEEIRQRIFKATELTASAGIAPNTMLAKVCSDQNKPNGQFQIYSTVESTKQFIASLPVKKVSGIGPVQGQILNSIGINTCSDMWEQRDLVANLFSPTSVDFYMRVALGIGSTSVNNDHIRKSIGNERTFKEIHKREELHMKCQELCNDLVEDLKSHHLLGKVVVLKIKTTSFETHTRNFTLMFHTSDPEIIHTAAAKLLDAEINAVFPQPLKLRLMGVRMCNVVDEAEVSNDGKRNVTLKAFLQSKLNTGQKSSADFHKCPVCSNEYQTSLDIFNNHVNNCLENNICNGIEDKYVVEENCSEYGEIKNKTEPLSKVPEERSKYICPICNLSHKIDNLKDLNSHIDNCLNRATIKEILADDSKVPVKRPATFTPEKLSTKKTKTLRKEKKINEYFQ